MRVFFCGSIIMYSVKREYINRQVYENIFKKCLDCLWNKHRKNACHNFWTKTTYQRLSMLAISSSSEVLLRQWAYA